MSDSKWYFADDNSPQNIGINNIKIDSNEEDLKNSSGSSARIRTMLAEAERQFASNSSCSRFPPVNFQILKDSGNMWIPASTMQIR